MRIWIMACVTFREAARKKILGMALLAGGAFLILFGIALHFQIAGYDSHHVPLLLRRQMLSGILMLGLYAINSLMVVMTVLTSVDAISGEIASGAIQAVATKPIRRSELLIGKWLGFAAMLLSYLLLLAGGLGLLVFSK